MSIKLLQELAKAAKDDRDARVRQGEYMITFHPNDKELEADPEVKKYMDILNKKINTPEILDAIEEEVAEFNSQLMMYGTAMMKIGKTIKTYDISPQPKIHTPEDS